MGYGENQIRDLEKSINAVDCDLVLFATPVNLKNLLRVETPMVRVRYEYKDAGSPTLQEVILRRLSRKETERGA
jgi:predicted GTPase